jgi:hypothetical protein
MRLPRKNNPTGVKIRAERRDDKRAKAKEQRQDNRRSVQLIAHLAKKK